MTLLRNTKDFPNTKMVENYTTHKPIQYFTTEYLEYCKSLTPIQIAQFLEDFRLMFAAQHMEQRKKA